MSQTFLSSEPILALRAWLAGANEANELQLKPWTFYRCTSWPAKKAVAAECLNEAKDLWSSAPPVYVCRHAVQEKILPELSVPHNDGACGIHGIQLSPEITVAEYYNSYYASLYRGAWTFRRPRTDALIHMSRACDAHNNYNAHIGKILGYWAGKFILVGIVALWGRVLLGSTGVYRAQYGYPVALFASDISQALAETYGISAIPVPTTTPALFEAFEWARTQLKAVPQEVADEPRQD